MRRPGIGIYLIGNPISTLALFGFTAWLTWRWYNGDALGIAAVIFGFVTMSAFDASNKLNAYRHWQQQWDAMGGARPRPGTLTRFTGSRIAKLIFGVPLWCAFAIGAVHVGNDPAGQAAAALFWLGTLLLIAVPLYRIFARRRAAARTRRAQEIPFVSVCLPVPHFDEQTAPALSMMPGYCRTVLSPMPGTSLASME